MSWTNRSKFSEMSFQSRFETQGLRPKLVLLIAVLSSLGLFGCGGFQSEPAEYTYQCETSEAEAFDYQPWGTTRCGEGDPLLVNVEPTLPTDVCQTLVANKTFPDENDLDTARVQAALVACKGRAVKLVADGDKNIFLTAHLEVDSVTLWVDEERVAHVLEQCRALSGDGQLRKDGRHRLDRLSRLHPSARASPRHRRSRSHRRPGRGTARR